MWILLLLIRYFSFFRETTTLLDVEGWDFLSFLAFIIGPIVLLFATNLLIAAPDAQGDATLDASYFALSSRFFAMLALVQVWVIGLDVAFGQHQKHARFARRIALTNNRCCGFCRAEPSIDR